MPKRVGLLGLLLVVALGSGAVAQSPSPEPPPWFGGRVEMPEHGFAVTLPDDWVAFDTTVDAVGQLGVASDVIDPEVWANEDGQMEDAFAEMAWTGVWLYAGHATRLNACGLGAVQIADVPLGDVADLIYEAYVEDPTARDVEPPQRIDLPAGPAYLMRMSERDNPDWVVWTPTSVYALGKDGVVLVAICTTSDARPDDDWRSIVETIEFLPADE